MFRINNVLAVMSGRAVYVLALYMYVPGVHAARPALVSRSNTAQLITIVASDTQLGDS